jgi:hypothetical protein
MGNNENKEYYSELFKDYPDVVRVYQLKEMLPKTGKNKIYKLLKDKKYIRKELVEIITYLKLVLLII